MITKMAGEKPLNAYLVPSYIASEKEKGSALYDRSGRDEYYLLEPGEKRVKELEKAHANLSSYLTKVASSNGVARHTPSKRMRPGADDEQEEDAAEVVVEATMVVPEVGTVVEVFHEKVWVKAEVTTSYKKSFMVRLSDTEKTVKQMYMNKFDEKWRTMRIVHKAPRTLCTSVGYVPSERVKRLQRILTEADGDVDSQLDAWFEEEMTKRKAVDPSLSSITLCTTLLAEKEEKAKELKKAQSESKNEIKKLYDALVETEKMVDAALAK